jgi:hypothetical protein
MSDPNSKDKKTEPIKKEAAPILQPKPKYYYDVKVECMLPAVITYKVLAEDPHQAIELIRGKQPNHVTHKLIGRKELVLRVYDAGSSMMRFMKRLMG